MRVDLCLQGVKLQDSFIMLILLYLIQKPVDALGHGYDTLSELSGFVSGTDGNINVRLGIIAEF